MSAVNERADHDGAKRPSGASNEDVTARALAVAESVLRAFSHVNEHAVLSGLADELRRLESRDDVLRSVIQSVSSTPMKPELWAKWLGGGPEPFAGAKLSRIHLMDRSNARALDFSTTRVQKAEERVQDAAKKLAEAQSDLEDLKALDAAMIHYVISDHLANILRPVFAMGPAWTLMRAISSHVNADWLDEQVEILSDPLTRERVKGVLREQHAASSLELLEALDFWSGDPDFENQVRNAIMVVVEKNKARVKDREADGIRHRSPAAYTKSIRQEAVADHVAVIDGLKPAASAS